MQPLADRLRPTTLDEVVGHERWLAPGAPLRRAVDESTLRSLILWGPPGCGKTTIARLLAAPTGALFLSLSAVLDGVKELRGVISRAETARTMSRQATVLFVDEIHRWNKAQQDALLPHVESGAILLIGATTENPSFQINPALRSRVQLVRLDPVPTEAVVGVLRRAMADPVLAERDLTWTEPTLTKLGEMAGGDVRQALSDLETAALAAPVGSTITLETLPQLLEDRPVRLDRGEDHFNVTSALIKSLRGSDPDAALYWLARLVRGGEDPTYIARRLVIFAAEDVGNADPRALTLAVSTAQALERIGLPEGRIPLAQCVTWLATCPKSNAAYLAIDLALADVDRLGPLPVPLHLRNASTREMKAEGYGRGYRYPHDFPDRIVRQQYLPDALQGARYYTPVQHGVEKTIHDRLEWWRRRLDERDG
ncbi:MAG: putative ATPase [Myxococcota bacterium]